jgi:hypothetical protein
MPAKIIYATLGAMTGGMAYAVTAGDYQTAETIWVTSLGGTYVVTPRMLQGEDAIAFAGTPGASDAPAADGGYGVHGEQVGGAPSLHEQPLGGS